MSILITPGRGWVFRIDFRPHYWTIGTEDDSITLSQDDNRKVNLRSLADGNPLKGAEMLTIEGSGYPTQEAAERAAKQWRDTVALLSVSFDQVIDFASAGRRRMSDSPSGGREPLGDPMESTIPGVAIYNPEFMLSLGWAVATLNAELTVECVTEQFTYLAAADAELDADLYAACTLYNSAMIENDQSVRLVLLVTAVESLSRQDPLSEAAQEVITVLQSEVMKSPLVDAERQSLRSRLDEARRQSVRSASKRVIEEYVSGQYVGLSAVKFFDQRYSARSKFVHNGCEYDTRQMEADNDLLRTLVADLIRAVATSRRLASGAETSSSNPRLTPHQPAAQPPQPAPTPPLSAR